MMNTKKCAYRTYGKRCGAPPVIVLGTTSQRAALCDEHRLVVTQVFDTYRIEITEMTDLLECVSVGGFSVYYPSEHDHQ